MAAFPTPHAPRRKIVWLVRKYALGSASVDSSKETQPTTFPLQIAPITTLRPTKLYAMVMPPCLLLHAGT